MKTLRKLTRTRWADWAAITMAYAYLLVAAWRLLVRRHPLDRSRINRPAPEKHELLTQTEHHTVARAARWTNTAARYPFPWARCLQRSLALCLWLEREGVQPALRIGVRKDGKGISAHAWVEYKGHIVNDSDSVDESFSVLGTALPPKTSQHQGHRATEP